MILANVYVATARSTFTGGMTGPAVPYLDEVEGHIMPIPQSAYKYLPVSALESEYQLKVNSGQDIKAGDTITSIVLKETGDAWPSSLATNENYIVSYARESTPGPLAYRIAYLTCVKGGGPA